ncbi:uncharacterized protein LOC126842186 isoform X2 [Adelges cooleyi]|uniref:uncharacterized protein LOC126842186 isoform X2 n=1 Tax=Adelges cooleyi TaxID=133065 RepID=UPI002180524F|nr:uncharacterized protein LOC126842186 isoform X2 [Adelges cooleyi]
MNIKYKVVLNVCSTTAEVAGMDIMLTAILESSVSQQYAAHPPIYWICFFSSNPKKTNPMATCDVCVHLSDIMTPRSFSTLLTTLMKYLVYEKQLIPYPYDRLKLYVKKYNELQLEGNSHCNIKKKYKLESDKYYKKVSDTINALETVFKCIENEFLSRMTNHIETVVILIGSNVLNPLTVFNIHVPELSYSHSDKQHSSRQHIDNVFRSILNNDKFNEILTSNIMVETNLYVMFKVKKGETMVSDWCVPKEQFRCLRGKQVMLRFDALSTVSDSNSKENCRLRCSKDCLVDEIPLIVDMADDKLGPRHIVDDDAYKDSCCVDWYLGKHHVTGFKNYKYNGVPISDTWLNPNIIDRMVS